MTTGTFYGVGVGPGDPELLTLKALSTLERCPVLAVPQTKSGGNTALDIVSQKIDLSAKTILPLPFPMTRDDTAARENHRALATQLLDVLQNGRDVAMITLGDVSLFSTVSYFVPLIRAAGVAVELVPGVTSFCAAAAKLQRSLTEKSEPLHIVPAGYSSLKESLSLPGTKVLMKPGKDLTPLLRELEERGLLNKAAMAVNCGLPGERILSDLTGFTETETGYFTTILIGANEPDK